MSVEEEKIEETQAMEVEDVEVKKEKKEKKEKKSKKEKKEKKEKKDKKEKKEKKDKKDKKEKKEKKEKKDKKEKKEKKRKLEEEQEEQESKKQKTEESVEATEEEASEEAAEEKTEATEETQEESNEVSKEPATVFVGNLSFKMTEDWLAEEFQAIGEVVGARIITDRESGRSKGYGYVDFADKASADKAVNEYNGKELDGRELRIDYANAPNKSNKPKKNYDNKPRSAPSKTVFIGNLSWNTTEQTLSDMFNEFGNVISIRIPTEKETGRKKGFGYVEFDDVESATKALEISGTEVDGRNIRLDYAPERNNQGGNGGNRGGRGGNRFGGNKFGGKPAAPKPQGQKITFDD